jgi:hypothetical protein
LAGEKDGLAGAGSLPNVVLSLGTKLPVADRKDFLTAAAVRVEYGFVCSVGSDSLKKMFSRPVRSGWKPVRTSSNEPTRPLDSAAPSVGGVTPDRILNRVLLPEPVLANDAQHSPRPTSNETSFKAQKKSCHPESEGRIP